MDQPEYEQRIREAAYHLWVEAGRPEGGADEFWRRARAQVFAQDAAQGSGEAPLDQTLADSFPASDPPNNPAVGVARYGAFASATA